MSMVSPGVALPPPPSARLGLFLADGTPCLPTCEMGPIIPKEPSPLPWAERDDPKVTGRQGNHRDLLPWIIPPFWIIHAPLRPGRFRHHLWFIFGVEQSK